MMTVSCKYLDGIGVVWIGRFWHKCAFELSEVVVDAITM
jgi:hypothetical protein